MNKTIIGTLQLMAMDSLSGSIRTGIYRDPLVIQIQKYISILPSSLWTNLFNYIISTGRFYDSCIGFCISQPYSPMELNIILNIFFREKLTEVEKNYNSILETLQTADAEDYNHKLYRCYYLIKLDISLGYHPNDRHFLFHNFRNLQSLRLKVLMYLFSRMGFNFSIDDEECQYFTQHFVDLISEQCLQLRNLELIYCFDSACTFNYYCQCKLSVGSSPNILLLKNCKHLRKVVLNNVCRNRQTTDQIKKLLPQLPVLQFFKHNLLFYAIDEMYLEQELDSASMVRKNRNIASSSAATDANSGIQKPSYEPKVLNLKYLDLCSGCEFGHEMKNKQTLVALIKMLPNIEQVSVNYPRFLDLMLEGWKLETLQVTGNVEPPLSVALQAENSRYLSSLELYEVAVEHKDFVAIATYCPNLHSLKLREGRIIKNNSGPDSVAQLEKFCREHDRQPFLFMEEMSFRGDSLILDSKWYFSRQLLDFLVGGSPRLTTFAADLGSNQELGEADQHTRESLLKSFSAFKLIETIQLRSDSLDRRDMKKLKEICPHLRRVVIHP